jgi:ribosomal protein L12E/L44/L45/RPP1/RPP2
VDGPVLGAIITASAALAVAIGGGLRRTVQAGADRRYERRREFLVDAQDAMLGLREALATYGVALHEQLNDAADPTPPGMLITGPSASSSFVLAVPAAVNLQVDAARARLAVARSRLEDDAVSEALQRWAELAQASMIDPHDTQTAAEEAAFEEVNGLIHAALQSSTGRSGS